MYRLCSFLTMILPAAFHDAVIAPLLERPATMLRKTRKVIRLLEAISPFSITDWDFKDDNVRGLWSLLSGRDRVLFPLDVEAIDWDTYCKAALAGSKRYLLKEDGAVGHPRRLYLLHRLTQTALASVLLALLGWATWPYLARLWPSSTVKFIKFVLSKC
ncbi:fatty acyl-CoA reductase wat-like [Thrips palmi]|uniref:Fatty acyl-CoA reductase wat-like n=1 Tax=Thrips palmi TaxID=161013 RepID=A0A6P8ZLE6_THRPL|nr:fatty acyl-CoA reductase wat-like [Thrips palmi]